MQITDIQQEHQREMEALLENVRQLSRELRQHMLIIDQFIPPEYQVTLYSFTVCAFPQHIFTKLTSTIRPLSHSRFLPTPADSVLSRRQPTYIG